jgi:hypothetical protein
MKTIKTTKEGWECVPELREVSENLDSLRNTLYEIDNCVRESSVEDIVTHLQETLQRALEELEYIDTDVEYETVYED